MKALNKITTVTDKICYYVSFFSMAMIVLMMFMITADVILKKYFGSSISGCYEICQMALSTLIFSSWAYTQSVHGHIHVTMIINKFPQALRFVCFSLMSLISVVTMCFGIYGVYYQIGSVRASGECTGTLLIPYWPFYIFEWVAFILLAVVLFRDAIKAVIAIWNTDMATEIQEHWD
ncbi:MAG: TRAP transporter small permease [Oscillospiraceae bacterium]|nr:TRAP transporter small permease [Oscillospiraceae bacterium]